MDNAQAHGLLAGCAALIEHFEEYRVPPVDEEVEDGGEAHTELAEQAENDKGEQEHGRTDQQVDAKGNRPGHEAGRTQEQVDAFRSFHPVTGIQKGCAAGAVKRHRSTASKSLILVSCKALGRRGAQTRPGVSAGQLAVGSTPKMVRYSTPMLMMNSGRVQIRPIPSGIMPMIMITPSARNRPKTLNQCWLMAVREVSRACQGDRPRSITSGMASM